MFARWSIGQQSRRAAVAATSALTALFPSLGRDGRWLASVRLPDNLIPLDIRAGRLLAVERDQLDVERVVVRTVVM